jgi:hypothetical protein
LDFFTSGTGADFRRSTHSQRILGHLSICPPLDLTDKTEHGSLEEVGVSIKEVHVPAMLEEN